MSQDNVSSSIGVDHHLQRPGVAGRTNAKEAKPSPANRATSAIAEDQTEVNNHARPDCGADESRHLSKNIGNRSVPNCGGVGHPEKSK